ncbi:hypothetical protein P152DRAFT_454109 [Eremomyces bilateralis CBS 781.70]|uniref:GPI anchored protein n=1 Tax=Eremomyces bilateralis CBS 781.70 TaxID=1392243 RepID=A0A6G1GHJ2_9PEZI|nr:uncharacterized protein P152DRAFT_454109 [Eremomyces bilateralis CBS 781.70]KAF1817523.1 hypothetical protein P152DRAFT_454109 [Eremomyces bilateralis CBS 781.70]
MQLPTSTTLLLTLLTALTSALPQPQADSSVVADPTDPGTTTPVDNPFTIYTSMTDSLGVITGMPSIPALPSLPTAVTELPSLITSQPILASIPAGLTEGLNTVTLANTTAVVSVGSDITSVVEPSTTTSKSGASGGASGGASESGFEQGSGSPSSSSGMAALPTAAVGYAAAGLGLMAAMVI